MESPQKSRGTGREALLSATVRVVAQKGLRGLTFRAVAAEAGVNNTLIAHHFGSRDKLLTAALAWSEDRSLGANDLAAFAAGSPAFREQLIRSVLDDPDLELFQFEMTLEAARRPELQPSVSESYQRYLSALRKGRPDDEGSPRNDLDVALFAALDGLMLQFLSKAITAEQVISALEALSAVIYAPPAPQGPAGTGDAATG